MNKSSGGVSAPIKNSNPSGLSADLISGFVVFLLALPLSLGIAGASDFPPVYGLITAMIGGMLVSLMAGSELTIKGPAAGLIVIVAGSVAELGNGDSGLGWKLALGAIVVAGIIQIFFGLLKLGSKSDFFPLAAIHGMLAAIGIIIISKQAHILFGMNPLSADGKPMFKPVELLLELGNTFSNPFIHLEVAIEGLVSLALVFVWPYLPFKFLKKIPSALVVLLVSVLLVKLLGIQNVAEVKDAAGNVVTKGFSPLLSFKEGLIDILGIRVSFAGISQTGIFIKYVIMFALVGSLEALLTVKAIDILDPFRRKSNLNKDLIALGIGNIVAGTLGGLPMISEVARSSANVNNGGRSRWANFFHGFFIFLFLLFAVSFSDLIPKSALAAMLIGVGWKLAHPKEFAHMAHIGWDQLTVFIGTLILTLVEDLLVGIAFGMLLHFIFHLVKGARAADLFRSGIRVTQEGEMFRLMVGKAAAFTNLIGIRKALNEIPAGKKIVLDFSECQLVDHSVLDNLHQFEREFCEAGGQFSLEGMEGFKPYSAHPEATRVRS